MSKITRVLLIMGLVFGSSLSVRATSRAAQDPSVEDHGRRPTLAHVGEAIFQAEELLGPSSAGEKSLGASDQPHQFHGDLFGPEKRLLPQDVLNQPEKTSESPQKHEK